MTDAAPKLYLLDVEGTVAPISLVTGTGFAGSLTYSSNFFLPAGGSKETFPSALR